MKLNVMALVFLLLIASNAKAQSSNGVFDVTKYGAKANSDISQELMSAWREACALATPSMVVIPDGAYRLSPVTLEGPCKAPV